MPKKDKPIKVEKLGTLQSDFISLASHQLRTPLSGMRWLLELLQKERVGTLNKKQKEYLEKIYFSNERMIALVNDLLEVTRLEQGENKIFPQPTDVVQIVRGIIREKENRIKQKSLKISFTTETEPFPLMKTDQNKIKQAIGNLFENAITYTPENGEVHIDMKIDGSMALFSISDSGVGIPNDQQNQIFSKFFRGSNVLKFETVGTGLGLFISKAFIENSGGKVWFKSKENQGTTFYFTLPIIK